MCLTCICKLRIRFDFYIGERRRPTYLMVSDPITMKKDRLHINKILAKELLKSIKKNNNQRTTQSNKH